MEMDYYMDSEIIETLNILRPPVTRDHKRQQDYVNISNFDGDLVRDFEEQINSKHSQESSLSLILQKTSKKQIFEKYSFVSSKLSHLQTQQIDEYISNFQHKPTIRVTVIPKKDKNYIIKFLESQKQITNIIKNKKDITSAHDEKFIATKKVYLIVAGSKEEKIYEIKTTGSSKTFKVKAKNVKKPNNTQSVVLNMEKKRKKLLNETKVEEDKNPDDICLCNCRRDSFFHDAGAGSSRVRIFGRIGLNENDNYVMKCAATVNGQPVTTDDIKPQKKTNFQSLLDADTSLKITNESQATQVDIGVVTECRPTFDQKIQCSSKDFCHNTFSTYKTENRDFDYESEIHTLKGSNSPLVIISVYPKQELNTFKVNKKTDNTSSKRLNNNHADRSNVKEVIKINNFEIKKDFRKTRERSSKKVNEPRFISEADKTEIIKSKNTNLTKSYTASRSASPTNKSPKFKVQERKKNNSTDNYAVTLFTNEKKQQKHMNTLKQNINTNNIEIRSQRNSNTRSKSKSRDKSVNTIKVPTNSVSAEKFTKKISNLQNKNSKKLLGITIPNDDMPMDRHYETVLRKSNPNNDTSKVSVNIDSEKEFYDVIFEKRKFSTNLIVRKTTKDIGSQKYFEESCEENIENNPGDDCKSDSLENFFPSEVIGRHRRSVSQAFNNINDDLALSEHMPRLNVRDSLEIGHRREDGKDLKTPPKKSLFLEYDGNEDNERDFSAPVKHFTGDNCIISDPVERDKKIRELLGIDVKRTDKKADETQITFKHKLYRTNSSIRKTFSESIVTSQMLRKCSCLSCIKIKMKMESESNNINISSNAKQNSTKDNNTEQNSVNINETLVSTEQQQKNYRNSGIETPIIIMQSTEYEFQNNKKETNLNQKAILLSKKQYRKVKKSLHKLSEKRPKEKKCWNSSFASVGTIESKHTSKHSRRWDKEVQNDSFQPLKKPKIEESTNSKSYQESTVVLFSRDKSSDNATNKSRNDDVKNIASSEELKFTGFEGITEVTCSHTDTESLRSSKRKKYNSIETIFRGQKKTHTPNLGASALSLLTEEIKSVSESLSPDKPKKPFLRRLMSCLVMRSVTSEMKLPKRRRPAPTINSSFDSYHINTSIEAIEMSSSIYDTSASFYSNYTIGPINKAKRSRGFFSSVREFLATKKS